jgi:hypothetical protein
LGERLLCKQEVTGSIPVSSTRSQDRTPHLFDAGRQTDTVIIYFTVTRNVVLAPIIGQVRRAEIVQLHLTLSESCKVKTGSPDQPIAAQAAQA